TSMIENMLNGGVKELFRQPEFKKLAMSGIDMSTAAGSEPTMFMDDTYIYYFNPRDLRIYRAPVTGLTAGTLAWVVTPPKLTAAQAGPRMYHQLAPLPNGDFIYFPAAGGSNQFLYQFNSPKVASSVPVIGTVSLQPDIPLTLGVGQAVVGEYLYYFGGYTRSNPTATLDVYRIGQTGNPVKHSTGPVPKERGHMSVAAKGNKIYMASGIYIPPGDGTYPMTSELWCYDIDTTTWTRLADLPTALHQTGDMVELNGFLYVYGGTTTISASDALAGIHVYNIRANKWRYYSAPEVGARFVTRLFAYNNKIYLTGGRTSQLPFPNDLWEITV
ncbi:MAG: hypothetical protein EOM43_14080, partial [Gammaproteobacteria bacterium]|nr:hypothetical protein [Gammaproteobacteria bacterium]